MSKIKWPLFAGGLGFDGEEQGQGWHCAQCGWVSAEEGTGDVCSCLSGWENHVNIKFMNIRAGHSLLFFLVCMQWRMIFWHVLINLILTGGRLS